MINSKKSCTFVVGFTKLLKHMKVAKQIFGLLILSAGLMACQSKGTLPSDYSEKTGFNYNDPQSGFFNVNSVYDGKIPPGTVYISVMTTVKGSNNDPVSAAPNNPKRRISNSGYFLDEFEVTNLNWREYVAWLSGVYAHDPRKVLLAMPDETVWRKALAYNEPVVENYYSHVAYGYYPVVGVTWKQAEAYCEWRTDRVNELELVNQNIIPFRDLKTINARIQEEPDSFYAYVFSSKHTGEYIRAIYGDSTTVDLDGILYDAQFRLPTEAEWEYAAYGIQAENGNVFENQSYPWKGDQMRGFDSKKTLGDFRANFIRSRGDLIGQYLNNTYTVPVNFFPPNGYGLYNMAGNVNEWVLDVYRATTNELVEEYNSFRGNVYASDSAYAETILNKLPPMDQVMRDSMRNVLIKEKKFAATGGDFRSYKDGDRLSVIGDSILRADQASKIEKANMISDEARVYKGGSWRDRAFWLDPANRRYLNENKCSDDIGFRCAMSSVGGKKQK